MRAFVLRILTEGPMHGYGIMRKLKEITGFTPSPGHMYLLLRRLEREGLIEVEAVSSSGRRMKIYRISDKGREFLKSRGDLLELTEACVRRFKRAKEVGLHKLYMVLQDVFASLDSLSDEDLHYLKEAVKDFARRVKDIVGG